MDCKDHAFNAQLHKDIEKQMFEEYSSLSWGFLKPVSVLNRQEVSASGTILFSYISSQKGIAWAALKTWLLFTQPQLSEFLHIQFNTDTFSHSNRNYVFIEKSFYSPTCYSTQASCHMASWTCHGPGRTAMKGTCGSRIKLAGTRSLSSHRKSQETKGFRNFFCWCTGLMGIA